jgi:hypothetical protein
MKRIHRFTALIFAAIAAVALSATHLMATTLPSLPPGSQYQIVFVTADTTLATNSDIEYYNSFVTAEANSNSILASLGVQWKAVASTAARNAITNAPSSGLPVYNTAGLEVASAATGLYTLDLLNPIAYDQNGASLATYVYTGSFYTGQRFQGNLPGGLGQALPEIGRSDAPPPHDGQWMEYGSNFISSNQWPVYALSEPITVPEPAAFTLFGSSLLLLGGFRWQRQRRRALAIRSDC